MVEALVGAGFTLGVQGRELTATRKHHLDPTMSIKIYTSLPADVGDVRACGEDAIRALLLFENTRTEASGCLYKAPRVYRTGSEQAVVERTLERARECYAEANKRHRARLAAPGSRGY
jgi:hypothetical protein